MVAVRENIALRTWPEMGGHLDMERGFEWSGEIEGLARKICLDLLNNNAELSVPLEEVDGKIRRVFRFRALVETTYWLLGETMGAGHLKRCMAEDCRALFIQTDPRQQYCPPP
jgi:hypothetical protein